MKVSEITAETVLTFSRIDEDAPDKALVETMFLPAAKQHISGTIGMTEEEMDQYPDLAVAVCALCAHMYDNRSVEIVSDKVNQVVMDIIGKYDRNLIPRGQEV